MSEEEKKAIEITEWKYIIDTYEDLDRLKELDLIKIKGKEYISKDKIKEIKEILGHYKHLSWPDEEQVREQEQVVDATAEMQKITMKFYNRGIEVSNKEWQDKIKDKIKELDETRQYWTEEVIEILDSLLKEN